MQRFDELTEPPVAGKFYLVLCVRGMWYGQLRDWPVWGPKHEDAKFLNFPQKHYHLNRYFVTDPRASTAPLSEMLFGRGYDENNPLPEPVLRKRKCLTNTPEPFPILRAQNVGSEWMKMRKALTGAQCNKGPHGWVCPHKGFDLGSTPTEDGVILCPLHGMRIDALSGKVLGADH